jgi:two-component system chemotaxis response regulator CheB
VSEPPGSPLPSWVVAIGASAGGLAPINRIVESLPDDLDAAVLVVLHLAPTAPSALPKILARHSKLPVDAPRDGEPLLPGHVYVARPDYHLEVEDSVVRVLRGPWENGHRPAVDVLFRSVAQWWGPRAIAIVLSGALDAGTAGLTAVRGAGPPRSGRAGHAAGGDRGRRRRRTVVDGRDRGPRRRSLHPSRGAGGAGG